MRDLQGFTGILRDFEGFTGILRDFEGFTGILRDFSRFLRDTEGVMWSYTPPHTGLLTLIIYLIRIGCPHDY